MRTWTSLAFAWMCLPLAIGVGPSAPWLAALVALVGLLVGAWGGRR